MEEVTLEKGVRMAHRVPMVRRAQGEAQATPDHKVPVESRDSQGKPDSQGDLVTLVTLDLQGSEESWAQKGHQEQMGSPDSPDHQGNWEFLETGVNRANQETPGNKDQEVR